MMSNQACENCKSNTVRYCDGFVYRNWSGKYAGDPALLPNPPDKVAFWTYSECKKNAKGLKFINLHDKCQGFEKA
jgi:hypothetical protein